MCIICASVVSRSSRCFCSAEICPLSMSIIITVAHLCNEYARMTARHRHTERHTTSGTARQRHTETHTHTGGETGRQFLDVKTEEIAQDALGETRHKFPSPHLCTTTRYSNRTSTLSARATPASKDTRTQDGKMKERVDTKRQKQS